MSRRKKEEAEKLVRTQVLNIDEVRKVVKYEKKISKKPALVFALLGTFMIAIGTTFQGVVVYTDKNTDTNTKQKDIAERRSIESEESTKVQEVKTSLTCFLSSQGNENGTNYESHFTYNFINNELKSATKIFMLDKIIGNAIGESSMTNLYTAYQTMELSNGTIDGYSIKTAPRGDVGFQITTQMDLTKVDMTTIPANYQANQQIKIDFPLNTTYDDVKTTAEQSGYICTPNTEQE